MRYIDAPWLEWFSGEYENGWAKLKDYTPKEIREKYEKIKRERKEEYEKNFNRLD